MHASLGQTKTVVWMSKWIWFSQECHEQNMNPVKTNWHWNLGWSSVVTNWKITLVLPLPALEAHFRLGQYPIELHLSPAKFRRQDKYLSAWIWTSAHRHWPEFVTSRLLLSVVRDTYCSQHLKLKSKGAVCNGILIQWQDFSASTDSSMRAAR